MQYFESRLRVNFEDIQDFNKKIDFCERLEVKNVIIEPISDPQKIPHKLLREISINKKINIFLRNNIRSENLNDFKNKIAKVSNLSNIISVETSNKEVQIHAARDSRVDVVSYSNSEIIKTLTDGVISLVKQNASFIEFSLAPLIVNNKSLQSKNFRNLYRFLAICRKLKAPVIISGNFENVYDLRQPRSLISICTSLLGVPINEAKKFFKENPISLINRAKNRQNKNIFENGVRIIEE